MLKFSNIFISITYLFDLPFVFFLNSCQTFLVINTINKTNISHIYLNFNFRLHLLVFNSFLNTYSENITLSKYQNDFTSYLSRFSFSPFTLLWKTQRFPFIISIHINSSETWKNQTVSYLHTNNIILNRHINLTLLHANFCCNHAGVIVDITCFSVTS